MKVNDIICEIEKKAPKYLKESYDNVGLMVGSKDKAVKSILLALDCTNKVIDEAISKKTDLIITHHPLLFKKPNSINAEELQGSKIIKLIKNDIALYSCHTNLDNAKDGVNDEVVKLLGFKHDSIIEYKDNQKECGTGRIIKLKESKSFDEIIALVKEKLDIKNLRIVRGSSIVNKIAVINGSGQDYFYEAKKAGADCIITGDTTYHFASDFKEMNISIIDAGHFGTEYLPFLKSMSFLKEKFPQIKFIKSESSNDPYEFI